MLSDLLPPVCYASQQWVIALGALLVLASFFLGRRSLQWERDDIRIADEPTETGVQPDKPWPRR